MNTEALEKAARRISMVWYLVMLAGMPTVAVVILIVTHLELAEFGVMDLAVADSLLWPVALGLIGVAVVVGLAVGRRLLVPARLARRSMQADREDALEAAALRVNQVLFIQLSVYDLPAMLFVVFTLVSGDTRWLGLAVVYMVALALLTKPDVRRLLQETTQEIQTQRSGGNPVGN